MKKIIGGGVAIAAGAAALFAGGVFDTSSNVTPTPGPSPSLTGKFLHLSDIHFDPFYDGKHLVVQDLDPSEWQQHFDADASLTTAFKEDSNFALMMSALKAAAATGDHDFIMFTGDYLAHDFREYSEGTRGSYGGVKNPAEFAAKTVEFVNLMIAQEMPGKKIVAALGNNDAGCGDYNLRPGKEFLADLGPEMPNLPDEAEKAFVDAGFYSIAHPTVPDTDFLVLGTFWSHRFPQTWRGCDRNYDDAAGTAQKDWLKSTLSPSDEEAAKRRAILLMHIPPGIDGYGGNKQWHGRFEFDFEKAVPASKRPVVGAFAGHTHMDEMRVLSDGSAPYLAVRVAPSVTTYNGNRPSFTVADYDTSTGAMTDYEVYSYRGTSGGASSWASEYRFSKAYKLTGYTPANIQTIAGRIQDNDDTSGARAAYLRYYSGKDRPSGGSNREQILCAISYTDTTKFRECTSKIN